MSNGQINAAATAPELTRTEPASIMEVVAGQSGASLQMPNKTIAEGLRPYSIGEKLRRLRLKKSMGLVQLGKHTGLSPAMLSKLERGKLYPTLPTLLRIAMVFSVGLEHFFTDESKRRVVAVVRGKERMKFPERPDTREVSYFFETLDYPANERRFNSYFAEFQDEKPKPHTHAGAELVFVISGVLLMTIGSDEHLLEAGDSIYFDANSPHTYRRSGKIPCTALVITAP